MLLPQSTRTFGRSIAQNGRYDERMMQRILLAALISVLGAAPAAAKEYHASRFDVRVELLRGGSLRVTETIVFAFTEGTFREVFRTIPTSRTDGVDFVSASMDGREMRQGDGAGSVRVRRDNGLRIEWRFAPVSPSAHTFELTYIARGVVQQTADADLLEWRALPREHDYRIESSTVEIAAPEAPAAPPSIEARRVVGAREVTTSGGSVVARATEIRGNGSFIVTAAYPPHSVLDGAPAWQSKQQEQRERLPLWLTAAGLVMAFGLVVLFGMWQNYDAPPREPLAQWDSVIPPDHAAPAIAGALIANGQPHLEHAMAAMFSLAERGVIAIREDPRGAFGTRHFMIELVRGTSTLPPHEQAALEIVFDGARQTGAVVPLSKARGLFTRPRHWRRFKNAVMQELADEHMLDATRQASRRRYQVIAVALGVLTALAVMGCAVLADDYGPGPFFIPLALAIAVIATVIVIASQTPLSNEGVRRADRWRAFKKHIKDPQSIEPRWGAAGSAETRILPLAIALGLASAWSKYLKKRNAQTPAWFHAASGLDSGHAFAAFVASGGAGAHGHAHGGGAGGVAGGGASGAH
jgi:hypothetical protein